MSTNAAVRFAYVEPEVAALEWKVADQEVLLAASRDTIRALREQIEILTDRHREDRRRIEKRLIKALRLLAALVEECHHRGFSNDPPFSYIRAVDFAVEEGELDEDPFLDDLVGKR